MQNSQTITEKIERLSVQARKTIKDLIELLGEQQRPPKMEKPTFNRLRGCLKPLKSTEQEMKELKQIWDPR